MKSKQHRGFSLMEVLVVVSVVGILGSIAVVMFVDALRSSSGAKLTSDVKNLNSAVLAYLSSNGDLSSAKTASEAIAKLKTVADEGSAGAINGYRGGFLDVRVEPVMQTAEEAASGSLRAYWDAAKMRFIIATSGDPGIKKFQLNEDLALGVQKKEIRKELLALAKDGAWIWDYTEAAPTYASGPTAVPVATIASLPVAPLSVTAPPPVAPPPPAAIQTLAPPRFSIPSGTYPFGDFDLTITLTDPNPAGTSQLYYRVDFGSWTLYPAGGISVAPASTIQAQAHPVDSGTHSPSPVAEESYLSDAVILDPPLIIPDYPNFGLFDLNDITVTLSDVNDPGTALLQYSINSGPWMDYTTEFVLTRSAYPTGATVEARSVSAGNPYYLPSTTVFDFFAVESADLNGSSQGVFNDPIGPSGMVTNLGSGDSSSYFEWGDANGQGRSESWMDFAGTTFSNIVDGLRFNVGSLTYYNGTIGADTGADSVDLDIALTLDINGTIFNPYFNFTFDLVNTPNSNDAIASADYVFLDDARSSRTLVFNDYEFEFKLEFGETTANGFSEFDKFHVIEKESASVNLYGTFSLLGPVAGATVGIPLKGGLVIDDNPETGREGDPIYQKVGYLDPVEYAKANLEIAHEAFDTAKSARDDAVQGRNTATSSATNISAKIADGKYLDAENLARVATDAAESAQIAAITAVAAADRAMQAASRARSASLDDSDAEDEAVKALEFAIDARALADEATAAANAANLAAAQAESLWANAQATAPTSDPAGFASYLAVLAAAEADSAMVARDAAEDAAAVATKAALDLDKKIRAGDFYAAASLVELASPAALDARAGAELAEEAAVRARAAADQAAAIAAADPAANKGAQDAAKEATNAETFASAARSAADEAEYAALTADAVWADILANGPAAFPEDFAVYLATLAQDAEDAAKIARDQAKIAYDQAKKLSGDAIKKAKDGKFAEAEQKAADSAAQALLAEEAAILAETQAVDARSNAVQAGTIAASDSVAQNAYNDANVAASNAEYFAQEARNFAVAAATVAADAEAALP